MSDARKSGADEAADALMTAAWAGMTEIRAAITMFGATAARARLDVSLEDRIRAVGEMIVATEALAEQSEAFAKAARAAVARTMADIGATPVELSDGRVMNWSNGARRVVITGAVPEAYMTPPQVVAPKPDTAAIAALLKKGVQIPNCTLSNGGDPVLVIKKGDKL